MTLVDVINLFDTDEKCRELLVRLRWPNGVECLRCKAPVVELATAKQLFYCKDCDYQFSVTASTIFNDSHLPLTKWFLATLLLCEARKGMSANQIKRSCSFNVTPRGRSWRAVQTKFSFPTPRHCAHSNASCRLDFKRTLGLGCYHWSKTSIDDSRLLRVIAALRSLL